MDILELCKSLKECIDDYSNNKNGISPINVSINIKYLITPFNYTTQSFKLDIDDISYLYNKYKNKLDDELNSKIYDLECSYSEFKKVKG